MRPSQVILTFCLAVAPCSAADPTPAPGLPPGRLVDLTHTFGEDTIYWPTEDGFRLEVQTAGMTEKGYYYSSNKFTGAEHGGTHVDAPIHFFKDRNHLDEIPLERLVGPAFVIDVTEAASMDPDYQVSIPDLEAAEQSAGARLDGHIVLLRTGRGKYWPDRVKYLGTDKRGAEGVKELHFPGLHPDAAKWLAGQREVKAVGIDTASIDFGQSTHYQSHVSLFEKNVPAFENVAGLEALPARGATVIALPMKIGKGSGGPLRIIAIVP